MNEREAEQIRHKRYDAKHRIQQGCAALLKAEPDEYARVLKNLDKAIHDYCIWNKVIDNLGL